MKFWTRTNSALFGQPELMNSERNEKITEDMEEKLKMLNRLRAMSMRMVV